MRQRLSWDQEKVAEMAKKADPYTMNQDHKNNPVEKYNIGGPSDFAEDPDMKIPWKTEGRTETGHPAPAREAVKSVRQLEDKALKCITIAQRMLPGASDEMIELQATELMYMPENSVVATLQRQAAFAESLKEVEAKKSEEEEEEEVVDPKKEKAAKKSEEEEEEVVDPKKEKAAKKSEEEEEEVVDPKKEKAAKKKSEEEEEEVVDPKKEKAAKKSEEEEEVDPKKEKAAKKKSEEEEEEEEEKEEEEKEASVDLLDSIFANEEKTGAKKLSGIVKQASDSNNSLDSLWSAPPDVSKAFK